MPEVRRPSQAAQDNFDESSDLLPVDSPLRITNVIAKASVNCELNLQKVEEELPMAQYIPHRFSGLLLRLFHPVKAHCQLYKNGKITINGGTTPHMNYALAKRFTNQLIKIGYVCSLVDYDVVNVVCSVNLQRTISFPLVYPVLRQHFRFVDYNPELFPGMSVRLGKCTAVIFHSGKINFLGSKTFEIAYDAYVDLLRYL